jgi:transposase-like protein
MAKRASAASPRRHWTEADARRVLAEWERSGDSLEAFARSRGLVPERLAWWRKRLRAARPQTTTALTFIPCAPASGPARAAPRPASPRTPPSGPARAHHDQPVLLVADRLQPPS